jgi:hypothetical protein
MCFQTMSPSQRQSQIYVFVLRIKVDREDSRHSPIRRTRPVAFKHETRLDSGCNWKLLPSGSEQSIHLWTDGRIYQSH